MKCPYCGKSSGKDFVDITSESGDDDGEPIYAHYSCFLKISEQWFKKKNITPPKWMLRE